MNTTPISIKQLGTSTTARCSPITEFYNPNVAGGTDFFFFGLTANCVTTRGCIMSQPIPGTAPTPVAEVGGTSGIVIDNQSTLGQASSIYFANLAGTSNAVKLTQSGLN